MVRQLFSAVIVASLGTGWLMAGSPPSDKPSPSLGELLSTLSADEARAQADAWLKTAGKSDDATKNAMDKVWADMDRSILDRVTDSLMIGSPEAKRLLTEACETRTSAPTEVPAMLKDTKVHPFLRANLALAYARALSERRIYEESRDCLMTVKPEQVVDPAQYLFLKAVSEHALIMKKEAVGTIDRLLEDVSDAPERYVTVAALMIIDMELWKEKDLGWIQRKMGNIERRLEIARGGKKTQEMERQVVMALDDLIKKLEPPPPDGPGRDGPSGDDPGRDGPGGNNRPTRGKTESTPGSNTGPGEVNVKQLTKLAEQWGKLPGKERVKALAELTREMPPAYREAIEGYFRKIGDMP